jgi:hypothetical protein
MGCFGSYLTKRRADMVHGMDYLVMAVSPVYLTRDRELTGVRCMAWRGTLKEAEQRVAALNNKQNESEARGYPSKPKWTITRDGASYLVETQSIVYAIYNKDDMENDQPKNTVCRRQATPAPFDIAQRVADHLNQPRKNAAAAPGVEAAVPEWKPEPAY